MKQADFFFGGLSPAGFHGYFSALASQPEWRLYLIKSGPGCGKSTLMKRLAQYADQPLARIHCASDPDSLDGLLLPGCRAAVVDATAPHTLEPQAPGAAEEVVSLYHTLDNDALQAQAAEILALFRRCACLQDRAARCFASAAGLLLDSRRAAACATDFEAVRTFGQGLCRRYLPKPKGKAVPQGRELPLLLSAVTPKGLVVYQHSIGQLAETVVVLQDEYGAVSRVLLEQLRADALAKGHTLLSCRCPMDPEQKLDHLILPELGLAFVTQNSWHPMELPHQRRVRCQRFADGALLRRRRARLRFDRKAAAELLQQTSAIQQEAKAAHDELEAYYRSAVDFAAVEQVGAALAQRLGIAWQPWAGPQE